MSCGTLETPNRLEPEAWRLGLRYGASQCRVKDTRWEAQDWISGPAKGRLTSIPPASTMKPIPTPNASNVEQIPEPSQNTAWKTSVLQSRQQGTSFKRCRRELNKGTDPSNTQV